MLKKNALELTGYCGLYCPDCIRYKSKASKLADKLLVELEKSEFEEYAKIKSSPKKQLNPVKALDRYPECIEVLDAIANLQCNIPCRIGGGCPTFSCDILKCCTSKGYNGCWQCETFARCNKFEGLHSIHGESPTQNLKEIKKNGINNWTKHRHNCYVWQK